MKRIILGFTLLSSIFILTACGNKKVVNNMQENIETNIVEEVQYEVIEKVPKENIIINEVLKNTTESVTRKKEAIKTPVKKEESKTQEMIEQPKIVIESKQEEVKKIYSKDELRSMIYKDTGYLEELKKTRGNQYEKNQLYIKYLKLYEAKYNK